MRYLFDRSKNCVITVAFYTVISGLLGCVFQANASKSQILKGYQPEIDVSSERVSQERIGDNEFKIFLRKAPEVEVQKNSAWCWAACIAALYNYELSDQGKNQRLTQEQIIRIVASHKSNQTGNKEEILLLLAPNEAAACNKAEAVYKSKPHAEGFIIFDATDGYYSADLPPSPDASCLVDELAKGRPVLAAVDPVSGSLGHIVVVYAARFSMASNDLIFGSRNPYYIHEIFYIDPVDGKPGTYKAIEANNAIDRVSFASSIVATREYYTAKEKAYREAKWVPMRR